MLRFLLNLSIAPLPAEEVNERYAEFLTEFVYYSLTSSRIKRTLCCASYLIYVNHPLAFAPEEDLCPVSYQTCCPVPPFSKIGNTKFMVHILL